MTASSIAYFLCRGDTESLLLIFLCDIVLFLNLYLCDNLVLEVACVLLHQQGSLGAAVDEEDSDWNIVVVVVFLLHDWLVGNANCDVG